MKRPNNPTPTDIPGFIKSQHEFTQYIRNPESSPVPKGIEERRADIYRELFYNNIEGFLADNFPVLKKVTAPDDWHEMVQDFFANHPSPSPYFSDIPEEFISYLTTDRASNNDNKNDPSFLTELAHYEWAELVMSIAESAQATTKIKNIETQALTLAETAWPLAYQYPVHKISPDFLPSEVPELPTLLVVYRNPDDDVVFLETNPTTHALLERLKNNTNKTTAELLATLAKDLQHPKPDTVIEGGLTILKDFIHRGIVISA